MWGRTLEASESLPVVELPPCFGPLSSLLRLLPLQLLGYHAACIRGTDVDKPPNLAKTVTIDMTMSAYLPLCVSNRKASSEGVEGFPARGWRRPLTLIE
jgi:hypothetical protein